jgi:membrane-bound lytic murein transglycosylase A
MRARMIAAVVACGVAARAELRPVAAPIGAEVACDDLALAPLAAALSQEHARFARRSGPLLRFGARVVAPSEYAASTLQSLATAAASGDRARFCAELASRYRFYVSAPAQSTLFTGYNSPSVHGSLSSSDAYRFPLYRRPPGSLEHATTAQILSGALRGQGLELVWLADPYDALALHIEGSGTVLLPDGTAYPVGTDGHNGQPYTNVSKLLFADGKLPPGPPPPASQPGNPKARAYFAAHPDQLNRYWGRNPHFVFFRRSEGAAGRLGPLTAGRSAAVDPDHIPLGSVLLIRAQRPVAEGGVVTGWQPFWRVVLAQDTGAGIRGPSRLDLYFGDDAYAQVAASTMSVRGDVYVVVAR